MFVVGIQCNRCVLAQGIRYFACFLTEQATLLVNGGSPSYPLQLRLCPAAQQVP
jgi:hypothetical protein